MKAYIQGCFESFSKLIYPIYRYEGWRVWYSYSSRSIISVLFLFIISNLLILSSFIMDDEILKNLLKCSLTDAEANPVILEERDLEEGVQECLASVYVRILTLKDMFISIQGFTLAMSKAWNIKDIRIHRLEGQIFHIFFPSIQDKKRIIDMGPWCFDNNLLIMKDWVRGVRPSSMNFDVCGFMVQVRGLASEYLTREVGIKICMTFDGVDAIELRKEAGGKRFFRFRAPIKIVKPLRRLIQFQVDKEMIGGYLSYERLPTVCLICGLMGHYVKHCPKLPNGADPRQGHNYGLWIKAPMEKSTIMFKFQVNQRSLCGSQRNNSEEAEVGDKRVVAITQGSPLIPPGFEPCPDSEQRRVKESVDLDRQLVFRENSMKLLEKVKLKENSNHNAINVIKALNPETEDIHEGANFQESGFVKHDSAFIIPQNELDVMQERENFKDQFRGIDYTGDNQGTLKFFNFQTEIQKDNFLTTQSPTTLKINKSNKSSSSNLKKRSHPYLKDDVKTLPGTNKKVYLSTEGLGETSGGARPAETVLQSGQSS